MAYKIYLSPSDQTANKYAYGGTNEAVQCRRIADALEKALKRCGFAVKNNKTDSMQARVRESNDWGADLHVPLHTNAYNGKVSGTRIFTYDNSGKGHKCAKKVFSFLAPVTPGASENISVDAELYEVKYTAAPCVYIESEFHDVAIVAKWIINHVGDIAEAICKGICAHFGVKYVASTSTTNTSVAKSCDVDMRVLSKGMSGNDVRVAMLILKDKGFYTSRIPASDKLFGAKMEAAVKAFQKAKGSKTCDGIIGAWTWKMLLSK